MSQPGNGTTSPARLGGRVLYLDFDGVLHPEDVWRHPRWGPYVASPPGHRLFEHADLLVDVLTPFPDVRIVLSTSWVRVYESMSKVARRLPDALRTRVVGATYHKEMQAESFQQMPRGVQIWGDVRRRLPTAWLALDDDDVDWPAVCRDHLVHTHPVLGISSPQVLAELQEKLAGMYALE
jgi:HAD domain in Swiss Army Knife RNA repair proteins